MSSVTNDDDGGDGNRRTSYRFEGIVTALSSISHIGDNIGAATRLRREKVIQPDLSVADVPIISGNGMRGMLRDAGMKYMLDRLGTTGHSLSLPAFYFLFSGGSLSKQAGRGLDIDQARRLQTLIPLVGVLGGAVGNQILPGRVDIGKLVPICAETEKVLPESLTVGRKRPLPSIWEFVQEEPYTRKDDEKDERLRGYLAGPELKLLDVKAEKKKAAGDELVDRETGQHQQMRYYCETLAAGTQFHWRICLNDVTEIEFEAFFSCLVEFSKRPVIGGKGNVGHGLVEINFDKWVTISPRIEAGGADLKAPLGELYLQHLKDNASGIVSALGEIA
jgi:CRISPR type IV-associated protein Csf2